MLLATERVQRENWLWHFQKKSFFVVGHAVADGETSMHIRHAGRWQKKHKLSSWQVTARLWMRGRDATQFQPKN